MWHHFPRVSALSISPEWVWGPTRFDFCFLAWFSFDFDILNTQEPNWNDPTVTGDAAHGTIVKHYAFDQDDPRKYYVYPGVSGNAYVEIVYSKTPDDFL